MKDHFGAELSVGDVIVKGEHWSGGTRYRRGTVTARSTKDGWCCVSWEQGDGLSLKFSRSRAGVVLCRNIVKMGKA